MRWLLFVMFRPNRSENCWALLGFPRVRIRLPPPKPMLRKRFPLPGGRGITRPPPDPPTGHPWTGSDAATYTSSPGIPPSTRRPPPRPTIPHHSTEQDRRARGVSWAYGEPPESLPRSGGLETPNRSREALPSQQPLEEGQLATGEPEHRSFLHAVLRHNSAATSQNAASTSVIEATGLLPRQALEGQRHRDRVRRDRIPRPATSPSATGRGSCTSVSDAATPPPRRAPRRRRGSANHPRSAPTARYGSDLRSTDRPHGSSHPLCASAPNTV